MRFAQAVAPLPDVYDSDWLLRASLSRLLGPDGHDAAEGRLKALAADVTDRLRDAHQQAEDNPPHLRQYDAWGRRVDRIETPAGWETQRRAAAEHAVVALPYLPAARRTWHARTRVVQHALLHLYGPESATYACPVAMSDGAAALLSRPDTDPALRERWLPRLIATDPAVAVTSGQWMTEAQGGSDVAGSSTVARPASDGWRVTGEKWFCSAADSALAVVLARPEGAGTGSRVLAPFAVPRLAADCPVAAADADPRDPAPGIRIHRLKDKLGTRALPTAEIGLDDAYAEPIGDPTSPGLARMMTLVRVARVHNAAAAAAGMRRGLLYAATFASGRRAFGAPLTALPLHRATLGGLAVDTAAAYLLAVHAFALLGAAEVDGDPAAETELRLVSTLAKLATGRWSVAAASEYLECFGGAGYVEDTGIPRLLRDAQVLPIWEGTTNVLSLDVLRVLSRHGACNAYFDRLDAACDLATGGGPWLSDVVDGLAATRRSLADRVAAATAAPTSASTQAGARDLAIAMAEALAAALLVEEAHHQYSHAADDRVAVVANLWIRAHLLRMDTADQAHRQCESLLFGDDPMN